MTESSDRQMAPGSPPPAGASGRLAAGNELTALERIVARAANGDEAAGDLIPAATVVAIRDGKAGIETLMLRRSKRGVFGGAWVFPGGHVEAADAPGGDVATLVDPDDAAATAAARRAAAREALEEAAVALNPERLVPLSFWVPPAGAPKRFATWFFLADAASRAEVVVDQTEIKEHRWMAPAAALAARNAGEIDLVPPTFITLWWLARRSNVADALRAAGESPVERFSTRLVTDGEGHLTACVWQGDAAYQDGDLARPGQRRRLLTPPDGWRVEIDT